MNAMRFWARTPRGRVPIGEMGGENLSHISLNPETCESSGARSDPRSAPENGADGAGAISTPVLSHAPPEGVSGSTPLTRTSAAQSASPASALGRARERWGEADAYPLNHNDPTEPIPTVNPGA
jgi:hypothetical protein